MRRGTNLFIALFSGLLMLSCSKDASPDTDGAQTLQPSVDDGLMVLGQRLENPYKTENVRDAFVSLYPTKSREAVQTTDLYVRFLPEDDGQLELVKSLVGECLDHPLDYQIVKEGDWYHDPDIPQDNITWMYAVVPKDFKFPPVRYEIIDECFISENQQVTRVDDVDWEDVERMAYRKSGNSDLLSLETKAKSGSVAPKGRITIVDDSCDGGKPVGVAGVKVVCNSFVKIGTAVCDIDGNYQMSKEFTSEVKYRLMFQNEKKFSIGFNFVIVPASLSALGSASPEGLSVTVTSASDRKLFDRCVVNNAAYDYIRRCGSDYMNICPPPDDIRIWILYGIENNSATMMHHGTILDQGKLSQWIGKYMGIIKLFAPDITIGGKDKVSYAQLYDDVCHEMAHASHFAQVGKDWWNNFATYIITSAITPKAGLYGSGSGKGAGYCEIAEMWGYHMSSYMHVERYGGDYPLYGNSWWFYPQIFKYLMDRGFTLSEIMKAMQKDVTSRDGLHTKLLDLYPSRKTVIDQVFARYY